MKYLEDVIFNNNIPIKASDHIYNIFNTIHDILFQDAVNKYIEDWNSNASEEDIQINEENFKILDLKNNNDLLKPSFALFINKYSNKKFKKIDLKHYWNSNYVNSLINNNIFDKLLISDEDKKNSKIESIDYINGVVKFKNNFSNKIFEIPFDKLNNNFYYNYLNNLKNTFGYKKDYGN